MASIGPSTSTGRDSVLCFQANRLQPVKWRQWKAHFFRQDEGMSDALVRA
jgi:hypothetical protein